MGDPLPQERLTFYVSPPSPLRVHSVHSSQEPLLLVAQTEIWEWQLLELFLRDDRQKV